MAAIGGNSYIFCASQWLDRSLFFQMSMGIMIYILTSWAIFSSKHLIQPYIAEKRTLDKIINSEKAIKFSWYFISYLLIACDCSLFIFCCSDCKISYFSFFFFFFFFSRET